jgi:methionyl-tRNA synthetase
MLPSKGRRNIVIDSVTWHYIVRGWDPCVIAHNPETGENIKYPCGYGNQITPSFVEEIIRTKGKPIVTHISKKKYITTTLPYANSIPHIGHAFEFIFGDALARYFRGKLGDENVHFNVGLDEHGEKIYRAALLDGKTPIEYLNGYDIEWKKFCSKFKIQYNTFYRTSHKAHYALVEKFWNKCKEDGLIYKAPYYGLYCVGCESKKTEKDLINGRCSDHPSLEIENVNETVYFFTLKKFQKNLQEWLDTNPILLPSEKTSELKNLISEIEERGDMPISRYKSNVHWGIPVPGDYEQVVYVWFEALLNYIFIIDYYGDKKQFDAYWDEAVQIFGPDNLRFQALVFQALLSAAGVKNTHALLCHGTILDGNGKKMSKTEGNVVDPIEQVEKYGIDAVRYFALAGLQVYGNSSWNEVRLVELYNSHLADNFGNLLSRVVHLIAKKTEEYKDDAEHFFVDSTSKDCELFTSQFEEVEQLWEKYEVTAALHKLFDILKQANQYITEKQPWKKECSKEEAEQILTTLNYVLTESCRLYSPVIPDKANEAQESLWCNKKIVLFPKLSLVETVK